MGQPAADLNQPEWRAELTRILTHWVADKKLDGVMLDAPFDYLARDDGRGAHDGMHDAITAQRIREVRTCLEPAWSLLGAFPGAFAEPSLWNLCR